MIMFLHQKPLFITSTLALLSAVLIYFYTNIYSSTVTRPITSTITTSSIPTPLPPKLHNPLVAMSKSAAFKFIPRLSAARGYADHDWLHSYHTFSFGQYYDSKHSGLGPLRVINEDHVASKQGFPMHNHREFEIFSYIVSGELTHKDSLGNLETMKRGDIQYTSAGTGISHSEYNDSTKGPVAFLQIWAKTTQPRLAPAYYTRHHNSESKKGVLKHIIAPSATFEDLASVKRQDGEEELIPITNDLNFYASILEPSSKVSHNFLKSATGASGKRLGYLHLIMSSGTRDPKTPAPKDGAQLKVTADDGTEIVLSEGDAVGIEANTGGLIEIESVGGRDAEFVFFDMGPETK